MSFSVYNEKVCALFGGKQQAIELGIEVVTCRGVMRRLESLRLELQAGRAGGEIHLCDALREFEIPHYMLKRFFPMFASRMQRTIAIFIRQRLGDGLKRRMDPCRSSIHRSAHHFFTAKVEDACIDCFARATAASAGTSSKNSKDIKSALEAELKNIWTETCALFIEDEQRSMQIDAADISKLIRFVEAVSKTDSNEAAALMWAAKEWEVKHVSERIRDTPWFDAYSVMWPEDRSAFVNGCWARLNGARCVKALVNDQQNLLRLSQESIESNAWVGVTLQESISTPQDGFMLLPPSHLSEFNNKTRRLFVVPSHLAESSPKQWNLLPVQLLWILMQILRNGWFPVGGVSNRYADCIVHAESNELASKVLEIREAIQDCVDDLSTDEINQDLLTLENELAENLFSVPRGDAEDALIADVGIQDFLLQAPRYSDFKICFSPNKVSTTFIVDYVVVHAVHTLVVQTLETSRLKGVATTVAIALSSLVSVVSTLIASRTTLEDVDLNSLQQTVPSIVRKLISFGKSCCNLKLVAHASNVEWTVQICGKRAKVLVVGRGSFDRVCDVFCEVCARVKGFLDENGTLPGNLKWTARRQRHSGACTE
jgi:hypothetical protein